MSSCDEKIRGPRPTFRNTWQKAMKFDV